MHAAIGVDANFPEGDFPEGDAGGVTFFFNQPSIATNLHSLYNNGGGNLLDNWNPTFPVSEELKKNTTQLIQLLPILPDRVNVTVPQDSDYSFVNRLTRANYFKQIVLESHAMARDLVYPLLNLTVTTSNGRHVAACPPDWYVALAAQMVKTRIALGGKHLAFVLTQTAKHIREIQLIQ